jgi:hypothetical protein
VANTTDPDSGILKTLRGWVQGYNAQAVVSQDASLKPYGDTFFYEVSPFSDKSSRSCYQTFSSGG